MKMIKQKQIGVKKMTKMNTHGV